jgi:hypothetical protein
LICIDANRPGIYRSILVNRDAWSVTSGVAASRDQAASDRPPQAFAPHFDRETMA